MESEWVPHLLQMIKNIDEKIEKQNETLVELMVTIEGLKARASIWGLAAGSIPAIGTVLTYLLMKK